MGTQPVSPPTHEAGAHAQEGADLLRRRLLLAILASQAAGDAERWERGAEGERKVGAILEGLAPDWHVLHDVSLGHGNIDHVLVGPGGTFTVETKSHRGHVRIDRIEDRMLRQAYAEKK